MKNVESILLAIFIVICVSCSKDGEMGPEGPKGPKGDVGAQGIPGTDGNLLLYGNESPSDVVGNFGDYYIDSQNYLLYGPKTSSGWGVPIILKGTDGEDGTNGNTLLSGMEEPTLDVGIIGDFYFHLGSVSIYGPKTESGWGNPINLKGDKGEPGTANVITTKWFTGNEVSRSWSTEGRFGTASIQLNSFQVQTLTQLTGATSIYDFVDKGGTLLVYFRGLNESINVNIISAVPGKFHGNNATYDIKMWRFYETRENRVTSSISQTSGVESLSPMIDMRLMLIPAGNTIATSQGIPLINSTINWNEMSYEELERLLDLHD